MELTLVTSRRSAAAPRGRPLHARILRARPWLFALYLGAVLLVTVQRGVLPSAHTTFPIFRASFHHLVDGRDLYAFYPKEQGMALDDRFKYSPTAALLFGPFSLLPVPVGLLLWNLVNAGAVLLAFHALLRRRAATVAAAVAFPWVFHAIQASSSNALVAALIVLAFVAAERERQAASALLVATGTLIKLFPASAVTFALFRPKRLRFGVLLAVAMAALMALPLLVTPPEILLAQYRSWQAMVTWDVDDLRFGLSIMLLLRRVFHVAAANWPVQLAGTALLLVPLVLNRRCWPRAEFRRGFLCSLLVFCVVFNHQAEHASFVIAATGLTIWLVTSRVSVWRWALAAVCVAGFQTVPFTLVWLAMQTELLTMPETVMVPERERVPEPALPATVPAAATD